jgi:Flp pilus assembly pilin Flp
LEFGVDSAISKAEWSVFLNANDWTVPREGNLLMKRYRCGRAILAALDSEESGQDLVEYALVAVMMALGAAASMGIIAKNINDIFTAIATKFRAYGT